MREAPGSKAENTLENGNHPFVCGGILYGNSQRMGAEGPAHGFGVAKEKAMRAAGVDDVGGCWALAGQVAEQEVGATRNDFPAAKGRKFRGQLFAQAVCFEVSGGVVTRVPQCRHSGDLRR